MDKYESKLYCIKEDNKYLCFFDNPSIFKEHNLDPKHYAGVIVREVETEETHTYYGWWSNKECIFRHVSESKEHIEKLLLYSLDRMEMEGKGRLCRVSIDENKEVVILRQFYC